MAMHMDFEMTASYYEAPEVTDTPEATCGWCDGHMDFSPIDAVYCTRCETLLATDTEVL